MTRQKAMISILMAALALVTMVAMAADAHACGGYGAPLTDEAQVRQLINRANAAQVRADRKAGHFAHRRLESIKMNVSRVGAPPMALVTTEVKLTYDWFTELAVVAKVENRWRIVKRIKLDRALALNP